MAVKRKNEKKQKIKEMYEKAVKIRCCYCDIRETCKYRARKESSERMGITTYCTMTPNKPKSFLKKQKRVNKA